MHPTSRCFLDQLSTATEPRLLPLLVFLSQCSAGFRTRSFSMLSRRGNSSRIEPNVSLIGGWKHLSDAPSLPFVSRDGKHPLLLCHIQR